MLRKIALFMACIVFAAGIAGCQNSVDSSKTLTSEKLLTMLGQDKAAVVESLKLDENTAQISSKGNQEQWSIQTQENNKLNITFYNGVFMAYQFMFDNLEGAYEFATEERKTIGKAFGEPTTYPGMSNTGVRFDEIDSVDSIRNDVPKEYYEDWTPTTDETQIKKMLNGKDFSRIDVRFSFSALAENVFFVQVRYVALP